MCAQEIDPVFYDRTYYLGAGETGADAYRLLHDALVKAERAGIGRWVFHNREYLVAIRPLDGVLALHTMRFADELVELGDLDVPEPEPQADRSARSRWRVSWSRRSTIASSPAIQGQLSQAGAGADPAQGQGRGDRDPGARGAGSQPRSAGRARGES